MNQKVNKCTGCFINNRYLYLLCVSSYFQFVNETLRNLQNAHNAVAISTSLTIHHCYELSFPSEQSTLLLLIYANWSNFIKATNASQLFNSSYFLGDYIHFILAHICAVHLCNMNIYRRCMLYI